MSWEKVSRGPKPNSDVKPEMRISASQTSINLFAIAALGDPTHVDIFHDNKTDEILIIKGDSFKLSDNGGGNKSNGKNWGNRKVFKSAQFIEMINKRLGECVFVREEASCVVDGRTVFGLVFKAPVRQ